MILRPPYIKGKGYCPNPVVKYGIPKEADGKNYPKVVGTPVWEEYWNEQLYYIINGYNTGGMWLPGRYYYYMNFTVMNTVTGVINPDPTDVHLELAYLIDYCKANGKNLMMPKRRRIGVSEASHPMIIDYGYRFSVDKYQGGVAAGHSKPIDDFMTKWKFAETQLPPEFFLGKLSKNDDEIVAGWVEKNSLNAWEDRGTKNTVYTRTMHSDVNGFKGLYLNDVVVEEVGEFEQFMSFYAATKDCLMSNQKQVGSMFVYGTAGNINKGSKDFKVAWTKEGTRDWCKANNFERHMIDGRRFYFYGGATQSHQQLPLDSDLFKKYKPYQLIGVEDLVLAEADIRKRRKEFMDSGDLKSYNELLQNNPLNEAEMFRKTIVNNFDTNKLNAQDVAISALMHPKYTKYKMAWAKDEKGMIKTPLEVKLTPLTFTDNQDECVWIIDSEHPRKGYANLYVAGVDSYDQDTAKASKSLGAMLVRIRQNPIKNAMQNAPVAAISCRPHRKEKFYEMCLMLSVYYNLIGNVLIDVANGGIFNYFKENGCQKYLARRPVKFESEGSQQTAEFGVRLTNFSRPRMVGLMQSDIVDNCHENWFPELIHQLGNYDEIEVGSDNDLADAYGIALMQDVSCEVKPFDMEDDSQEDRWKLPEFGTNRFGDIVPKIGGGAVINPQEDNETFGLLFGPIK